MKILLTLLLALSIGEASAQGVPSSLPGSPTTGLSHGFSLPPAGSFQAQTIPLVLPGSAVLRPVLEPLQSAPLNSNEKQAAIVRAGVLLLANYIFPDRAVKAKNKIFAAFAAGDYDGLDDASAFADRLTRDLQSVTHDQHMKVSELKGAMPVGSSIGSQFEYSGFIRVDRLTGNIGYIKLVSFPAPEVFAAEAEHAMHDLAGTDALIIDMRDNGGGNVDSVVELDSFFFDPKTPVHINDIVSRKHGTDSFFTTSFWTKPVVFPYLNGPLYLLTSKRTISGGEEFVNDLKVQARAKVFGEITSGAANPGGLGPLSAHLQIVIPTGRAQNPVTKTNWEGTGVTPDVMVDEKQAFRAAALDIIAKFTANRVGSKSGLMDMKAALAQQGDVEPFVVKHLMVKSRTPYHIER